MMMMILAMRMMVMVIMVVIEIRIDATPGGVDLSVFSRRFLNECVCVERPAVRKSIRGNKEQS
jgi:hypothetical protein